MAVSSVRKPLIAGNWKMHGSMSQVKILIDGIKQGAGEYSGIDVFVLPTFVHLAQVHSYWRRQKYYLGRKIFIWVRKVRSLVKCPVPC